MMVAYLRGGRWCDRPPPFGETDFLENVALSLHVCYCNFGMSDVHTVVFPACLQLRTVRQPAEGLRGIGCELRAR